MADPREVADALRYPKAEVIFADSFLVKCPACGQRYEIDIDQVMKKKFDCVKCPTTFRLKLASNWFRR